jgi:diketogulonate reductase-like aldo/keto reductase
MEMETIEMCKKEGILIEAYSTFAKWDPKLMEHEVLIELSKKLGKHPTQVLVRWAVQHGWVVLPKSTNPDRIKDNISIDDFEISEEDLAKLDSLNCYYKVTWNPTSVKF